MLSAQPIVLQAPHPWPALACVSSHGRGILHMWLEALGTAYLLYSFKLSTSVKNSMTGLLQACTAVLPPAALARAAAIPSSVP